MGGQLTAQASVESNVVNMGVVAVAFLALLVSLLAPVVVPAGGGSPTGADEYLNFAILMLLAALALLTTLRGALRNARRLAQLAAYMNQWAR